MLNKFKKYTHNSVCIYLYKYTIWRCLSHPRRRRQYRRLQVPWDRVKQRETYLQTILFPLYTLIPRHKPHLSLYVYIYIIHIHFTLIQRVIPLYSQVPLQLHIYPFLSL